MVENFLKTYFKNRPLFLGLIRAKELELFTRLLPPKDNLRNLKILDFGSGDGFFAKTLFDDTSLNITGIDIDEKLLEKAKREKVYEQLKIYDGTKLPFENNMYDLVISNSVLEHVENLSQTLQELSRVLKTGGQFFCSVMTEKWEDNLLGTVFLGKVYSSWMRRKQVHRYLLSLDEWQKQFEKAGFNTKQVIGYMDKKASRLLDFLHYPSVYSLISHKISGKWVLFPNFFDRFPVQKIFASTIAKDVPANDSSAALFVLENSK